MCLRAADVLLGILHSQAHPLTAFSLRDKKIKSGRPDFGPQSDYEIYELISYKTREVLDFIAYVIVTVVLLGWKSLNIWEQL